MNVLDPETGRRPSAPSGGARAEQEARRKREREEFAEEHRRQRARRRAEESAVDYVGERRLPTIEQIVDRIDHRRRVEQRAEQARFIRQLTQRLMRKTDVGVGEGVGSRRARLLVKRARCLFGRADVIQLLASFASPRNV